MTDLFVSASVPADVEAVGHFVYEGLRPASSELVLDEEECRRRGFAGKVGETLVRRGTDEILEVLIGIGTSELVDGEALRRAGAAFVKVVTHCAAVGVELSGLAIPDLAPRAIAQSLGEGIVLGAYRFTEMKSNADAVALAQVTLIGSSPAIADGIARAKVIAEGVSLARDLVNMPAGEMTPSRFAEVAKEIAEREGLIARILDETEITAERLGGLLGVARGSAEPPRFIRLEYVPTTTTTTTVALVGKGITFDSGGLSLKSGSGMMTMKSDMSGAAAVLGALSACRRLDVPVRVVGFMPLTENMPGGRAIKPGDVLKIRNGKTIEVLNTDAEGRLVLADALSLAVEEKPDAIIDLATLTGACVVALGTAIAGLMGNDDRLIAAIDDASVRVAEPVWPLPLPKGYHRLIDSDVADMKNIGGTSGYAGTLTAALLLEEFVDTTPWAHLDIAGPARSDDREGYIPKGGTGFGVRTLIELLEHYEPLGSIEAAARGKVVWR